MTADIDQQQNDAHISDPADHKIHSASDSLKRAAETAPAVKHYSWSDLFQLARKFRYELVVANLVALLATIASVPTPLLMSLMVDEVLLDQPGWLLNWFKAFTSTSWHTPAGFIIIALAFTILLRVFSCFFNVWQTRQFAVISKDIIFHIRASLLKKLSKVSMSEYEMLGTGSVAARFVTDINTIDQFIASSVSRLLIALLSILGTAIVLLWLHWQLALLILFFNPIVIWLTASLGKKIKELKNRENKALDIFQSALTEVLSGISQIRTANREQHYLQRLLNHALKVRNKSVRFAWKNDAANRISFVIFMLGIDIFRACAMITVLLSDLTIGEMFAVFGYLWFMMGPVNELLTMQYSFYAATAALRRINELLALDEEPQHVTRHNPFAGRHTVGITIEDVHFCYKNSMGNSDKILNGVTLSIKPGEKVALVGASGGGKSTLIKVLLGLYQADRGQIRFGDTPIGHIGYHCLREHVVMVLQHPVLFNTTVRENLTLGRDVSEQVLWNALDVAQLKDFIANTPEKLETEVGNHGVRLSGGQRQRMAIARMVAANPSVVILDESTSSLDSTTERKVHEKLASFLSDRTTLIVAHRLSAVRQADRVFVFEDGHIAESGAHEELIRQKGLYHQLYGDLEASYTS